MKRLIPLLSLVFSIQLLQAQAILQCSADTIFVNAPATEYDIPGHAYVKNVSNQNFSLRWVKAEYNLVPGWESAVCDNYGCYPSFVTTNYNLSGNPKNPVILGPGDSTNLDSHVYPNSGGPGTGIVKVFLSSVSQPNVYLDSITYIFNLETSSTTRFPGKSNFRIFPNPTVDYFSVQSTDGIQSIQLFNTLGRKLRTFTVLPGKKYYIGDLPAGLYLASLVDDDGNITKTLRLVKKSLRP